MKDTDLVLGFVDAVNARDLEEMLSLMSDEHRFIDSDGAEINGKEGLCRAWAGYFALVPDYRIEVEEIYAGKKRVVLVGTATGTYSPDGKTRQEDRWKVPAAWRAVVQGGRIAVWQVFVNPGPILRIMRKYEEGPA